MGFPLIASTIPLAAGRAPSLEEAQVFAAAAPSAPPGASTGRHAFGVITGAGTSTTLPELTAEPGPAETAPTETAPMEATEAPAGAAVASAAPTPGSLPATSPTAEAGGGSSTAQTTSRAPATTARPIEGAAPAPLAEQLADRRQAVYEWREAEWRRGEGYRPTLQALRARGTTELFVDITSVVGLSRPGRTADLAAFTDDLRALVRAAAEEGIDVQALGGDPAWATDQAHAVTVLDFAAAFNGSVAGGGGGLAGVHFDVEPWALPEFWGPWQTELTRAYVTLVDSLARRNAALSPSLPLGFAIPFWFDGTAGAVDVLEVDGIRASVLDHVVRRLAAAPSSSLVVMAYRNQPNGPNGSIALVQEELAAAAAGGGTTVFLGYDTGPGEPGTSYAGSTFARLADDLKAARAALGGRANFAGVAINDVAGLLGLPPA